MPYQGSKTLSKEEASKKRQRSVTIKIEQSVATQINSRGLSDASISDRVASIQESACLISLIGGSLGKLAKTGLSAI